MKFLFLLSIFLVGCFVDSKPEIDPKSVNNLNGKYESDIETDTTAPATTGQEFIKIINDSIEFYQIAQQMGIPNRTVTFSGGKYEIKNDSISFKYNSYARKELVASGKTLLDTINFNFEPNGFQITTRIIKGNNEIQIEYIGETTNHFVKFRKVTELSI